MAKIKKFEDIESWKQARTLTKRIYEVTAAEKFAHDFGHWTLDFGHESTS